MASNEYNIDDKYTIVVEEQDTFQLELNKQGPQGERGPIGPVGPQGDKGEKGDQGIQGEVGPKGDTGVSVVGVEEVSKVGLVTTYRMTFSNGEYFDYQVTDGSIDGLTRETIINIIGYEPASYTSVEGLTTRVSTLEGRVENLQIELDGKQDKLTAGENIDIVDNVISAKGGGSGLELCDIGMALYVDETKGLRRRLNGSIMDITSNYQVFLTRLKEITTLYPSLVCTESEWQTTKTMSKLGQCGKFVYNYGADGTTVTSIRLPLVININGLLDMANAGLIKNESLPNIKGELTGSSTSNYSIFTHGVNGSNGAFSWKNTASIGAMGTYFGCGQAFFNASDSSSTYKDGAVVQQEAIQYPYFIQVATGSETENNIINDIELNNPYSLFECKYADHELFNLSWLVSNGSYNGSNAVHPSAYQALLVEHNAEIAIGSTVTLPNGTEYTKQGISVKLSTETYTDYDFVIKSANETFRPPIKPRNLNNTRYLIEADEQDGIYYRIYSDGWCEQGGYLASTSTNHQTRTITFLKSFKDTTYNYQQTTGNSLRDGSGYGVQWGWISGTKTTISIQTDTASTQYQEGVNWQASGYLAEGEYTPLTDNILLYFYVGETVQNANLIDAGRIGEQLAGKVDVSNTQWATNACMPDYSAGITFTADQLLQGYVAPVNGVIYISQSGDTTITIDNVKIGNTFHQSYVSEQVNSFYISKAQTIKTNKKAIRFDYGVFFPLKGVTND